MLRLYQIKNPNDIALLLQIHRHILIQLGFRIGQNQTFPSFYTLENHISDKSSGFHTARCTKNSDITIHPTCDRDTDNRTVYGSQYRSLCFLDTGNIQQFLHPSFIHKSRCTIAAFFGVMEFPLHIIITFFALSDKHCKKNDNRNR